MEITEFGKGKEKEVRYAYLSSAFGSGKRQYRGYLEKGSGDDDEAMTEIIELNKKANGDSTEATMENAEEKEKVAA